MDNYIPKTTTGQEVMKALAEAGRNRPKPPRDPKVWEYANSLDAMEHHIARYLVNDLKIPTSVLPKLVPLIDSRWFEDRLEEEVRAVLLDLEESQ